MQDADSQIFQSEGPAISMVPLPGSRSGIQVKSGAKGHHLQYERFSPERVAGCVGSKNRPLSMWRHGLLSLRSGHVEGLSSRSAVLSRLGYRYHLTAINLH